MASPLSMVLSTIPSVLRIFCNCPQTPPSDNEAVITIISENFPPESEPEDVKLKTWPEEELIRTIENFVAEEEVTIDDARLSSLCRNLESELNEKCPFKVEEQYDFCVVCSSIDNEEAKEVTRNFEEKFGLHGYVVWDAVTLGSDQFDAFEELVERSSKVIFYLTDNFRNDTFCCHLATNTFTGNNEETKKKSVPVLDKQKTEVQEELLLVNKLALDNDLHIELRFPLLFSEKVKLEKHDRRRKIEMELDKTRLEMLKEIFKSKLNEM